MAKLIFKGRVIHNGDEYIKGQQCPEKIQDEMAQLGVVEALPEPVQPVEPPKKSESPKASKKSQE